MEENNFKINEKDVDLDFNDHEDYDDRYNEHFTKDYQKIKNAVER